MTNGIRKQNVAAPNLKWIKGQSRFVVGPNVTNNHAAVANKNNRYLFPIVNFQKVLFTKYF